MALTAKDLFSAAGECLLETDPQHKVLLVRELVASWHAGHVPRVPVEAPRRMPVPGRPARPELVHPAEVPRRSPGSAQGRVRLVHAIAHIEFNAINLALDAVYRFRDLPGQYYSDWLQVADEEATHFLLLQDYLESAGSGYGSFAAHNGLWEMAVKTDHDVLVRMALVPRVLEARGLDVTPTMIDDLRRAGDDELVSVLGVIFRDEIGHVAIGSHWFSHCCRARGLDETETFFRLLQEYLGRPLPGPFELAARRQAGFSDAELTQLVAQAKLT